MRTIAGRLLLLAAFLGIAAGLAWLGRLALAPSAPAPLALSFHVFGSLAELTVAGVPRARAETALAAVQRELDALHREWHPWEPGPLTALNAALARGEAHTTTPGIAGLIRDATPLVAASDGLFDPAAGSLVGLWGFHTSDYPITTPAPDDAAIAAWLARRPRIADLVLDGLEVRSANPTIQLDFNAMAEGEAARRTAALLRAHGVENALIALGGDLYALGSAAGRGWRAAVRDPRGGVLGTVDLRDGEALFSSGAYNRWRVAAGERVPHLLDPRDGRPARGALASAALGRDPLIADVAATVLMIAGTERWLELTGRLGLTCALLIDADGTLHITPAFAARLALLDAPPRVAVAGPEGDCR